MMTDRCQSLQIINQLVRRKSQCIVLYPLGKHANTSWLFPLTYLLPRPLKQE